jgi:hypothetical protein
MSGTYRPHPWANTLNRVWEVATLNWVVMIQPGGGTGGGGDASAANQTTEITKLTSIDGKTPALGQALAAASTPVVLTVAQQAALTPPAAITGYALEAGHLATIDTATARIPAQGQALAAACTPVVLPVAQITTLTPPAAITGFALDATLTGGTQRTKVTDGTNNAAVKAASTLPVATDPALVVTLRESVSTAVTNAGLTNLDVALSTRLKPADTLTGVTTVATVTTITNPVTVTPPTLTKGTQGATGFSVQELKDAGRVNIAWTALTVPAATAETLATITESRDGAATTTFTSKVITSGKRLRLTSVSIQVENSLGTSIQRAYLRMRVNTAGAVTTASPLQGLWAVQAIGTVKSISTPLLEEFPDGFEILGDGTKQIGFSLQAPDWVTASATLNIYLTIFGYEY